MPLPTPSTSLNTPNDWNKAVWSAIDHLRNIGELLDAITDEKSLGDAFWRAADKERAAAG